MIEFLLLTVAPIVGVVAIIWYFLGGVLGGVFQALGAALGLGTGTGASTATADGKASNGVLGWIGDAADTALSKLLGVFTK